MPLIDATYAAALKAIHAEMLAAAIAGSPKDDEWYCDQVAKAADDQIKTATVSTAVAVTSVSGVTTGAGVSGPGTGTGTGTLS